MKFRNASIRQKLILLIVLISVFIMLLVAGALLAVEIVSFRQSLVDKTAAMAQVLAVNSSPGLVLNQRSKVEDVLASLASDPHIRAAFVFRDGVPFAHYLNSTGSFQDSTTALAYSQCELLDRATQVTRTSSHFSSSHLGYLFPIFQKNRLLGQLYIQSDLGELDARLSQFGSVLLVLLVLSGLLAVFLASRLQRLITEPLVNLSNVMEQVANDGNFSIRAEQSYPDEIGLLVKRFNGMLQQLEERDAQLDGYRQGLERRVQQRTVELRQANEHLHDSVNDLAEARDRAEAANRAKSQFLANMSHEIRTPMIGVLGMTELLFNTGLNEKQQHLAQTVFNSGEALLEILNDLLDLSKIEAGKMVLVEEDFDLRECLEEVAGLFADAASRKSLRLDSSLPEDVPSLLRGDAGRLRQVLLNLVGNAVKFTEQGEVQLRTLLLDECADSVRLRFEVRDTGIGIDPAILDRVFDSFAQVDEAMNRQFPGTGLGLAIVRQLVEMMGGKVQVESSPGSGSCFWFEVPLKRQPRVQNINVTPAYLSGCRMLLVDENPQSIELMRAKLEARGFVVEIAATGRQALSLLKRAAEKEPFAVAFLDFEMAGLGGMRLAEAIAGDSRLQGTRRVMVCSQGATRLETTPRPDLVDEWLYKPVRSVRLAETLNALLQDRPVDAVPDVAAAEAPPYLPKGWRILLVEDNPTTRDFVQLTLGHCDGLLLQAHHGQEALDLLEENEVDLVLMDCQMPVVDGYEATRRLRARGFSSPIIALTANVFPEDINACHAAGMNGHLCKPFRREDLLGTLETWLTGASSAFSTEDA